MTGSKSNFYSSSHGSGDALISEVISDFKVLSNVSKVQSLELAADNFAKAVFKSGVEAWIGNEALIALSDLQNLDTSGDGTADGTLSKITVYNTKQNLHKVFFLDSNYSILTDGVHDLEEVLREAKSDLKDVPSGTTYMFVGGALRGIKCAQQDGTEFDVSTGLYDISTLNLDHIRLDKSIHEVIVPDVLTIEARIRDIRGNSTLYTIQLPALAEKSTMNTSNLVKSSNRYKPENLIPQNLGDSTLNLKLQVRFTNPTAYSSIELVDGPPGLKNYGDTSIQEFKNVSSETYSMTAVQFRDVALLLSGDFEQGQLDDTSFDAIDSDDITEINEGSSKDWDDAGLLFIPPGVTATITDSSVTEEYRGEQFLHKAILSKDGLNLTATIKVQIAKTDPGSSICPQNINNEKAIDSDSTIYDGRSISDQQIFTIDDGITLTIEKDGDIPGSPSSRFLQIRPSTTTANATVVLDPSSGAKLPPMCIEDCTVNISGSLSNIDSMKYGTANRDGNTYLAEYLNKKYDLAFIRCTFKTTAPSLDSSSIKGILVYECKMDDDVSTLSLDGTHRITLAESTLDTVEVPSGSSDLPLDIRSCTLETLDVQKALGDLKVLDSTVTIQTTFNMSGATALLKGNNFWNTSISGGTLRTKDDFKALSHQNLDQLNIVLEDNVFHADPKRKITGQTLKDLFDPSNLVQSQGYAALHLQSTNVSGGSNNYQVVRFKGHNKIYPRNGAIGLIVDDYGAGNTRSYLGLYVDRDQNVKGSYRLDENGKPTQDGNSRYNYLSYIKFSLVSPQQATTGLMATTDKDAKGTVAVMSTRAPSYDNPLDLHFAKVYKEGVFDTPWYAPELNTADRRADHVLSGIGYVAQNWGTTPFTALEDKFNALTEKTILYNSIGGTKTEGKLLVEVASAYIWLNLLNKLNSDITKPNLLYYRNVTASEVNRIQATDLSGTNLSGGSAINDVEYVYALGIRYPSTGLSSNQFMHGSLKVKSHELDLTSSGLNELSSNLFDKSQSIAGLHRNGSKKTSHVHNNGIQVGEVELIFEADGLQSGKRPSMIGSCVVQDELRVSSSALVPYVPSPIEYTILENVESIAIEYKNISMQYRENEAGVYAMNGDVKKSKTAVQDSTDTFVRRLNGYELGRDPVEAMLELSVVPLFPTKALIFDSRLTNLSKVEVSDSWDFGGAQGALTPLPVRDGQVDAYVRINRENKLQQNEQVVLNFMIAPDVNSLVTHVTPDMLSSVKESLIELDSITGGQVLDNDSTWDVAAKYTYADGKQFVHNVSPVSLTPLKWSTKISEAPKRLVPLVLHSVIDDERTYAEIMFADSPMGMMGFGNVQGYLEGDKAIFNEEMIQGKVSFKKTRDMDELSASRKLKVGMYTKASDKVNEVSVSNPNDQTVDRNTTVFRVGQEDAQLDLSVLYDDDKPQRVMFVEETPDSDTQKRAVVLVNKGSVPNKEDFVNPNASFALVVPRGLSISDSNSTTYTAGIYSTKNIQNTSWQAPQEVNVTVSGFTFLTEPTLETFTVSGASTDKGVTLTEGPNQNTNPNEVVASVTLSGLTQIVINGDKKDLTIDANNNYTYTADGSDTVNVADFDTATFADILVKNQSESGYKFVPDQENAVEIDPATPSTVLSGFIQKPNGDRLTKEDLIGFDSTDKDRDPFNDEAIIVFAFQNLAEDSDELDIQLKAVRETAEQGEQTLKLGESLTVPDDFTSIRFGSSSSKIVVSGGLVVTLDSVGVLPEGTYDLDGLKRLQASSEGETDISTMTNIDTDQISVDVEAFTLFNKVKSKVGSSFDASGIFGVMARGGSNVTTEDISDLITFDSSNGGVRIPPGVRVTLREESSNGTRTVKQPTLDLVSRPVTSPGDVTYTGTDLSGFNVMNDPFDQISATSARLGVVNNLTDSANLTESALERMQYYMSQKSAREAAQKLRGQSLFQSYEAVSPWSVYGVSNPDQISKTEHKLRYDFTQKYIANTSNVREKILSEGALNAYHLYVGERDARQQLSEYARTVSGGESDVSYHTQSLSGTSLSGGSLTPTETNVNPNEVVSFTAKVQDSSGNIITLDDDTKSFKVNEKAIAEGRVVYDNNLRFKVGTNSDQEVRLVGSAFLENSSGVLQIRFEGVLAPLKDGDNATAYNTVTAAFEDIHDTILASEQTMVPIKLGSNFTYLLVNVTQGKQNSDFGSLISNSSDGDLMVYERKISTINGVAINTIDNFETGELVVSEPDLEFKDSSNNAYKFVNTRYYIHENETDSELNLVVVGTLANTVSDVQNLSFISLSLQEKLYSIRKTPAALPSTDPIATMLPGASVKSWEGISNGKTLQELGGSLAERLPDSYVYLNDRNYYRMARNDKEREYLGEFATAEERRVGVALVGAKLVADGVLAPQDESKHSEAVTLYSIENPSDGSLKSQIDAHLGNTTNGVYSFDNSGNMTISSEVSVHDLFEAFGESLSYALDDKRYWTMSSKRLFLSERQARDFGREVFTVTANQLTELAKVTQSPSSAQVDNTDAPGGYLEATDNTTGKFGYFYPLYLTNHGSSSEYTFKEYPGLKFFMPTNNSNHAKAKAPVNTGAGNDYINFNRVLLPTYQTVELMPLAILSQDLSNESLQSHNVLLSRDTFRVAKDLYKPTTGDLVGPETVRAGMIIQESDIGKLLFETKNAAKNKSSVLVNSGSIAKKDSVKVSTPEGDVKIRVFVEYGAFGKVQGIDSNPALANTQFTRRATSVVRRSVYYVGPNTRTIGTRKKVAKDEKIPKTEANLFDTNSDPQYYRTKSEANGAAGGANPNVYEATVLQYVESKPSRANEPVAYEVREDKGRYVVVARNNRFMVASLPGQSSKRLLINQDSRTGSEIVLDNSAQTVTFSRSGQMLKAGSKVRLNGRAQEFTVKGVTVLEDTAFLEFNESLDQVPQFVDRIDLFDIIQKGERRAVQPLSSGHQEFVVVPLDGSDDVNTTMLDRISIEGSRVMKRKLLLAQDRAVSLSGALADYDTEQEVRDATVQGIREYSILQVPNKNAGEFIDADAHRLPTATEFSIRYLQKRSEADSDFAAMGANESIRLALIPLFKSVKGENTRRTILGTGVSVPYDVVVYADNGAGNREQRDQPELGPGQQQSFKFDFASSVSGSNLELHATLESDGLSLLDVTDNADSALDKNRWGEYVLGPSNDETAFTIKIANNVSADGFDKFAFGGRGGVLQAVHFVNNIDDPENAEEHSLDAKLTFGLTPSESKARVGLMIEDSRPMTADFGLNATLKQDAKRYGAESYDQTLANFTKEGVVAPEVVAMRRPATRTERIYVAPYFETIALNKNVSNVSDNLQAQASTSVLWRLEAYDQNDLRVNSVKFYFTNRSSGRPMVQGYRNRINFRSGENPVLNGLWLSMNDVPSDVNRLKLVLVLYNLDKTSYDLGDKLKNEERISIGELDLESVPSSTDLDSDMIGTLSIGNWKITTNGFGNLMFQHRNFADQEYKTVAEMSPSTSGSLGNDLLK